MRLTKLGKILILVLAAGLSIGGWRIWKNYSSSNDGEVGNPGGEQSYWAARCASAW